MYAPQRIYKYLACRFLPILALSFFLTIPLLADRVATITVIDSDDGPVLITRVFDISELVTIEMDNGYTQEVLQLNQNPQILQAAEIEQSKIITAKQLAHQSCLYKSLQNMAQMSDTTVLPAGSNFQMIIVQGTPGAVDMFEQLLEAYEILHEQQQVGVTVRGYVIDMQDVMTSNLVKTKMGVLDTPDAEALKTELEKRLGKPIVLMSGIGLEGNGCSWISRAGDLSGKTKDKVQADKTTTQELDNGGYMVVNLRFIDVCPDGSVKMAMQLGMANMENTEDETEAAREYKQRYRYENDEAQKLPKQAWWEGGGRYMSVSEVQTPGSLVTVIPIDWAVGNKAMVWITEVDVIESE